MSVKTINCKNREEWLSERTEGIGSSDIATIVGLNPYETPYSLWRRKLGLDPVKEETLPMKLGHLLEDSVATLYSDETGAAIDPDSVGDFLCIDIDAPYLRVSPDRFATRTDGTREIVECKTTQMTVDPDNLPTWWFAQIQYLMGVSGIHDCTLAWLTAGRDFGYQRITFVPDFYDFLRESARAFYEDCIKGGKEPDPISSEDILAKYGVGSKGKEVEADQSVFDDYTKLVAVRDEIDKLSAEKSEIEERIKLTLRDGTALIHNGVTLVTWRGTKPSSSFDRKGFEKDYPELAAKYTTEKPGTRRFLVK